MRLPPVLTAPLPPVAPYTKLPLPGGRVVVPIVFPLLRVTGYSDDYNQNRGTHRHTGIDMRAPKMTPIVAPFAGILGMKIYSFWIIGANGWQCLGTHLNDDTPGVGNNLADFDFMFAPNLRHGDTIRAGQLIGYVGDSYNATGPHLHFELHTNRRIYNPTASLKAATRLARPTAVIDEPGAVPKQGEIRLDGCRRGYDPTRQKLTLQMVAKQYAGGKPIVTTYPTRVSVLISKSVLATAGGEKALLSIARDRTVTLYARQTAAGLVAKRIVLRPDQLPWNRAPKRG